MALGFFEIPQLGTMLLHDEGDSLVPASKVRV